MKVDCRFRLSKSLWGVMGDHTPAGIVYMDLAFDQPRDCRLASATVLVTLEDPFAIRTPYGSGRSSSLQVTDRYEPKQLRGKPQAVPVKKTYHLTPTVNVAGYGVGGIGVDLEKTMTYTSRWSFSGQLLPAKDKETGLHGTTYRTLKWELTENDLEAESVHNNVIHTAFALEHEGKPFHMQVTINGKLQRKTDRIKKLLKFPSHRRKEDGTTVTEVNLGPPDAQSKRLDDKANQLRSEMESENLGAMPVEMQDVLPVSYQSVTGTGNVSTSPEKRPSPELPPFPDQAMTVNWDDTTTLASEDVTSASIENLAKALDQPSASRRCSQTAQNIAEQQARCEFPESDVATSDPLDDTHDDVKESPASADKMQLRTDSFFDFSYLLLVFQLLTSYLDFFGAATSLMKLRKSYTSENYIPRVEKANGHSIPEAKADGLKEGSHFDSNSKKSVNSTGTQPGVVL